MSDFPHAMLREIFEQPEAIRRTLDLYVSGQELCQRRLHPWRSGLIPAAKC